MAGAGLAGAALIGGGLAGAALTGAGLTGGAAGVVAVAGAAGVVAAGGPAAPVGGAGVAGVDVIAVAGAAGAGGAEVTGSSGVEAGAEVGSPAGSLGSDMYFSPFASFALFSGRTSARRIFAAGSPLCSPRVPPIMPPPRHSVYRPQRTVAGGVATRPSERSGESVRSV